MIKCNICQCLSDSKRLVCTEMTLGTRDKFEYIYCSNCGSLSILQIPDNLTDYYLNYPNLNDSLSPLNPLRKVLYRYILAKENFITKRLLHVDNSYDMLKIKSLYKYTKNKTMKILDVGCGNGEFIAHLFQLGFKNVEGIDPFFINNSKEHHASLKVLRKSIFEVEGKYDLITFHHSFEHMENLQQVSHKINSLLKKNGKCIIRIPNIESLSYKLFHEFWEGIHPPFHFSLPSHKGMGALFQNTDLTLVEKRWENPYFLTFYSLNRKMDISDFDELGSRRFFSNKSTWGNSPPLFTPSETKEIKKKAKLISGTKLSDYVNYYYSKLTS